MKEKLRRATATALVPFIMWTTLAQAATPTAISYAPINAVPPNVRSTPARPLIMLNMSKDHQLFYRAYNEFADYDNDGTPDGGYLHTVRYSGYFDTTKCYTYSTANNRFVPSAAAVSNLCNGAWHGNFLNWATMTRIDVLRKVLYGGTRSTDTGTLTVLERASLPMDAHSFAKYYVNRGAGATAERPDISTITPFASTVTEVTLCNTTLGDNNAISHTNTNAPLLRAASGNYSLWNAHERRQCRWNEETQWDSDGSGNGNTPATSGFNASANYPARATAALGTGVADGDYVVRVEACVANLVGSERCRGYPDGNLKPIGLLQEYGESNLAEFGLLTGSFSRNTSGGVLRKNAVSFRDEVNYTTNGTFANTTGIVRNIDRLKVYGFGYRNARYDANDNAAAGDQFCDFQTIGLADDRCASWGNPIGEMFIENLRYLAGKSASSSYGSNADAKGTLMGLTVATWADPLGDRGDTHRATFGKSECRPINTVNFNASVISYDRDTTGPFSDLDASSSLETYTNQVGSGEGIDGTSRFIGRTASVSDSACTAKNLANLWDARGLCPMAPAYQGSFSLAGAAYWANTNAIRSVPNALTGLDRDRAFRVRTYSVALAPGVPRITVRTTGSTPMTAVIQPSYRLVHPTRGSGSGTLVDFRVISQTSTSGSYLVVWEDSEQGGDYDNDVLGKLEWSLSGDTLTVTTQTLSDPTVNPQGFGYTISGTNRDGEHFHSGILGFNYTDATNLPVTRIDGTAHPNVNVSGGCANCGKNQEASRATYTVTGNPGGVLQDPMWYAAKWGGFRNTDGVATGTPSTAALWDSVNNATGAAGSDGIPDTYFEVFNPDQLEESLRRVFESAVQASNAAPAVSSSQLVSGGFKYIASFDSTRKNGNVEAFVVDSNGNFNTNPSWNVGEQLTNAPQTGTGARQVISNDQGVGFPFTWASINTTARDNYRALLKGATTTPSLAAISDEQAQRVVQFVRGDRGVEGQNGIRNRDATNIMGPIVSASPWLQDRPSARFVDSEHPGYSAFVAANRSRTKVLWAAAGDGMLHAFNATTGAPIMSYVPETLAPRLKGLTAATDIEAYVDGSPVTADVDLNAGINSTRNWKTFVFAPLGRGGRGVFALDATSVGTLAAAESNAASIYQWQFTANDDSDVGHILSDFAIEPGTGQPASVVKLQNGRYAYVFGNGYGSTNGKAVLFILPVQGPNAGSWDGRYYKIVLDNAGPNNGLSTPTLLDTNNDGRVDTAYVGDLRGNLWKVDLSGSDPATWGSSYVADDAPTPLYIATSSDGTTRLPITGAPQFSFPKFGGTMVTFATGQSVLSTDFPRTGVAQRVYGIWDRAAFAAGTRPLPRGTSTLVSRTLTRTSSGDVAVTSAASVDFTNTDSSVAKDGWYFNLPGSSEMVLSNIEYRAGNILFTSVRPANAGGCSDSPNASFYLLDPTSALPTSSVQGTVGVGGTTYNVVASTISDQKVRVVNDASARRRPPGPNGTPGALVCPDGSAALRIVGRSTDESLCFQQSNARFQWREIPGLRTYAP